MEDTGDSGTAQPVDKEEWRDTGTPTMEEVALGLPALSLAVQPSCPLLDVSTFTRPSACALDASLMFRSTQWFLLPRWKVWLQCSLECRGNSGRAWATAALNRDQSSGFQGLGKPSSALWYRFFWLEFTGTESHVTQASLHFTLHTKMIFDLSPPPCSQLLRSHTEGPHPCHVMQWRGNHWFTHRSKFRVH